MRSLALAAALRRRRVDLETSWDFLGRGPSVGVSDTRTTWKRNTDPTSASMRYALYDIVLSKRLRYEHATPVFEGVNCLGCCQPLRQRACESFLRPSRMSSLMRE
eukprot:Amastigsp_a678384_49.p5 type:complete len:105 gc:universal Amastigsp_a678384_49:728-414(-)